ncbi:DUF2530 domain-containing protein [Nocardia takedensis]|uniref:DUF2530 domain-containing protein n=1 Tax=Nocardia takedensis TaxID=259390 RepID=UPI0002EEB57F|nr:DUF2530 domain-containing protein [Nocardia takedensis]
MSNKALRIGIAVFVAYVAYALASLALGAEFDSIDDWISVAIKGFLVGALSVAAVEWVARRRAGRDR